MTFVNFDINVGDEVHVGKGTVKYTVIERLDDLTVRIQSDKSKRVIEIPKLTVITKVEPKVQAAEVTKKVSWLKRASQRIKGKRGRSGKLRNA